MIGSSLLRAKPDGEPTYVENSGKFAGIEKNLPLKDPPVSVNQARATLTQLTDLTRSPTQVRAFRQFDRI